MNVDTWRGYRCLGVYLYSDADGRVRWDDAPEDALILNVDHPTHLGLFQLNARADSDLVFTLKPSLAISGIVRDAGTRRGIPEARVEYGAVDPKTGEVAAWQQPPELGWVWYSGGYLTARFAVEADAYKIRILADGYPIHVSRAFRRDEKVVTHYDVALAKGQGDVPMAIAVRPDGRPLAGARVFRGGDRQDLHIVNNDLPLMPSGAGVKTNADGSFPIPQGAKPGLVLVLGDDCYGFAGAETLARSPRLQAQPFGRVEGRYLIGDRPGADRLIELSGYLNEPSVGSRGLHDLHSMKTDAEGRFAFEKVMAIPGFRLRRKDNLGPTAWIWSLGRPVAVVPGRTSVVTLGGSGRPVIGRVEAPQGWTGPIDFTTLGTVRIATVRTNNPFPLDLLRGKTSLEDRGWMDWMTTWPKSPDGQAYSNGLLAGTVALSPDGSFRMDDVPPGEYRVSIHVNEWEFGGEIGPFAAITRTIAVPPTPGGGMGDPIELGNLQLKARKDRKARVGDVAPPFEVTTVDGKKLAIPGDFRGKYLLLDLGTMWDDQSRLQVVRMNDLAARFGNDGRFAMLSLVMAADRDETRAFVAEKGEPWPQAIVGPLSNGFSEAYEVEEGQFPSGILIGPDGRIVARDLIYRKIGEAVATALGR